MRSKRGAGKQADIINRQADRTEQGQGHYGGTVDELINGSGREASTCTAYTGVGEVQAWLDVAILGAGSCHQI